MSKATSSSGNNMELYKAVLMIAYSEHAQIDLNMVNWQIANLEIRDDNGQKVLYVNNPYYRWMIRIKNVTAIERLYSNVGDIIRLRLRGNRSVLLYASPTILMKLAEILSKETNLIISDVVTEEGLLKKEDGVRT